MRIAILTELFHPSIGGQEVRFAELGRALVARGNEVNVYTIAHQSGLPEYEALDGVIIRRHPVDDRYTEGYAGVVPRNPLTILRFAMWVRREVRGMMPDMAIFNQWPLAHIALMPKVLRSRAVIDWCEIRTSQPYRMAQRWLPCLAALNIGVSRFVCAEIQRETGRHVVYIPSGVELHRYIGREKGERSGILYVGRIAPHKNLPLLVRAFERLRKLGYRGRLTIGGAGPFMDEIRRLAEASPERAAISVLGRIEEGEKVKLLGDAEVLVIPSLREGFPRVTAEAMASGTPVVTVDAPENGTQTVVREYGVGAVTHPDDSALAEGILEVLRDWERYAAAAMEGASELGWDALVDRLMQGFHHEE